MDTEEVALQRGTRRKNAFHLGMRHIAEGRDHLLFLLVLLRLRQCWPEAGANITAYYRIQGPHPVIRCEAGFEGFALDIQMAALWQM